jgi:hypothetical protein
MTYNIMQVLHQNEIHQVISLAQFLCRLRSLVPPRNYRVNAVPESTPYPSVKISASGLWVTTTPNFTVSFTDGNGSQKWFLSKTAA